MASKAMELYKKLKVVILAVVNTIVGSFVPEDIKLLVLSVVNGVFVIVDAIMQYKYGEINTTSVKVVKKSK